MKARWRAMTLSQRAEQAGPEETRGLLIELWRKTRGDEYVRTGINHFYRFKELVDFGPEAHLAAAMMLAGGYRRVEFGWYEDGGGWAYWHTADDEVFEAEAATPALALIAAIAKVTRPNDT